MRDEDLGVGARIGDARRVQARLHGGDGDPRVQASRGRLERLPPRLGRERLGELVQLALEHAVELVDGQLHAVVGDAALRIVVGADLLGALAAADLRPPLRGELGLPPLPLQLEEPRPQHAHRLRLVLQLRLLVLHRDDDPGREVGDPHGGVGRVHALAARSGRAVHVDLQVVRVDLDLDLLGLGHRRHGRRGGVDAPLGLGLGDALDAMRARLPT